MVHKMQGIAWEDNPGMEQVQKGRRKNDAEDEWEDLFILNE